MACTGGGVLTGIIASSPLPRSTTSSRTSEVHNKPNSRTIALSASSCSASTSTSTSTTNVGPETTPPPSQKFSYSKAIPSIRWPHLNFTDTHQSPFTIASPKSSKLVIDDDDDDYFALAPRSNSVLGEGGETGNAYDNEQVEDLRGRPSRNRTRVKKMNKLALKRAKDWRERVEFYTHQILGLNPEQHVAGVLDEKMVQMTPTDFCFVVKLVGQSSWQRAMEVYEWLNLRHWYSPNPRMLATVLGVLRRANQEALAVEIFTRAEPGVANTVQVYNAMMGVYARNGRFAKVQQLLDLMRERGC